jgi:FlaA1/EpsC-like NDP-sugar epimerase
MKYKSRPLPRGFILLADVIIIAFTYFFSYFLRFNFKIPISEQHSLYIGIIIVLIVKTVYFLLFGTYKHLIRFVSANDAIKMFFSLVLSVVTIALLNFLVHGVFGSPYIVPFSILIIDFVFSIFFLIGYRLAIKVLFFEFFNNQREKSSVIIYGAGRNGSLVKQVLERDRGTKYKVLAFIDEDPYKQGKQLEGIPIYAPDRLEEFLRSHTVAHLIIAIQNISPSKKASLTELCLKYNTKVLVVPPVSKWINGELSFKQIKKIKIEDILQREEINIDESDVCKTLNNKTILITGAAGSIGTELVKQCIRFDPLRIICFDIAETPLHNLKLNLSNELTIEQFNLLHFVLGDITKIEDIETVFDQYKPQIIFHAAAYKHVPILEYFPKKAIEINVFGTYQLVNLAIKYQAEKFIFISTDKAVNPSNIMGASKRMAELLVKYYNNNSTFTRFITTRFGNVLGSNGSVLEIFKQQIENGGPITVTHPEVTRFFMTIPEACRLVLEAASIGNGGEIFLFNMGERIKILDVAKTLIQLSGLTLGKDIQIKFTGLRPGEKMTEELLTDYSKDLVTKNKNVLISSENIGDLNEKVSMIFDFLQNYNHLSNDEIVKNIQKIVPEYKSMNSFYSLS